MPLLPLVLLALIQGITEFWPVSSSGHLILVWDALGQAAPGDGPADRLTLDVAVHVGTLAAVMGYFRRDVAALLDGARQWAAGSRPGDNEANTRLLAWVALATLPVAFVGMSVRAHVAEYLREPAVVGWTMLGFGLVLYAADKAGGLTRRLREMDAGDALIVGMLQILALIPGTSRAGITMTAGRMLGFSRHESARFALLLGMPAIAGAGLLTGIDLAQSGDARLTLMAVMAAGLACGAAWLAIAVMMRWLTSASFTPFVIYRVVLGAAILGYVYL